MNVSRDQIVAEARSWVDTPFRHQARLKGVGVDCVGVVVKTAHALGLSSFDTTDYARVPDPEAMRRALDEHLDRIPFEAALPGDVLWFAISRARVGRHLGVITALDPVRFVHAYERSTVRHCLEQRLDDAWRKRIVACYRYRGVA